jgi:hypothetical protein
MYDTDTLPETPEGAALRAQAALRDQAVQDSWERSDTDGFMSQWASGLGAAKLRYEADIADQGGRAHFPALFDTAGNLVAAKLIDTQYGLSWALLASDNPQARIIGWFNPSRARKAATRLANDTRKGYTVGTIMAPAYVDFRGSNAVSVRPVAVRSGPDFSRDVEIVTATAHYDRDY